MTNLRSAVYGAAIGDALGVPFEFRPRGTFEAAEMTASGTWEVPAGTFSDDTSMVLATCDSIRAMRGKIDSADMRERFEDWYRKGAYTTGGCFDIGNTTAAALEEGAGMGGERDNGNGSLMRIIPLAFVPGVTDGQIAEVSSITHAHEWSCRGCVIMVRLAQDLLAGTPVREAISKLDEDAPYDRLATIAARSADEISSTGFVVHTLEAALWCLANTDSFEGCVRTAVELGDDADTTGAVAGALAGIVYGIDAIPKRWMSALRGKDIIERVLFDCR